MTRFRLAVAAVIVVSLASSDQRHPPPQPLVFKQVLDTRVVSGKFAGAENTDLLLACKNGNLAFQLTPKTFMTSRYENVRTEHTAETLIEWLKTYPDADVMVGCYKGTTSDVFALYNKQCANTHN